MMRPDCDDDYECPPQHPCPSPERDSASRALLLAFVASCGAAMANELVPVIVKGIRRLARQLREPPAPPQPRPRSPRKP